MVERIDPVRVSAARAVVDYVVPRILEDGRFHPDEALWAETSGYQAQHAGTLAVAGKLPGDDRCISAARRIFDRLLQSRVEGLWSLGWWWDNPIADPPPTDWAEQNLRPDSQYTPTTLFNMGLYYRVTGDDDLVEPAREIMSRMLERWDYDTDVGVGRHMTREFAALCIWAWQDALPEYADRNDAVIKWVADTFVEIAPTDFPFVSAVRMTLLLAATGTEHMITIRQGIDALLAEPSRRFEPDGQDFRHNTSTAAHANSRANMAVAIMMKTYDLVAGEDIYTSTPLYAYLSEWIDNMRAPSGSYFEARDRATGQTFGQGSPAHYIPLWWILGARLP